MNKRCLVITMLIAAAIYFSGTAAYACDFVNPKLSADCNGFLLTGQVQGSWAYWNANAICINYEIKIDSITITGTKKIVVAGQPDGTLIDFSIPGSWSQEFCGLGFIASAHLELYRETVDGPVCEILDDTADPSYGPVDCPCPEKCWLTGGGVKFEPILDMNMATANKGQNGPVISLGGNVNPGCSPTAGEGGNWNHIDHKAKLHFQGTQIEVVECGNIPESIRPPGSDSPKTPFNYIEFQGTGTLKGISGNKVDYGTVYFYARAEDRNEPGSKEKLPSNFIDRYWIRVFDAQGNTLYLFGNDVVNPDTRCADDSFACTDTIAITGGNLQLHVSSCDKD